MRISTTALGRVVSSAVSFGRHEITKGTRKTRSIGPNIERWWKGNEVEIPGTKNARQKAFLDALVEAIFIITRLEDDIILFVSFQRRIRNRLMKFL